MDIRYANRTSNLKASEIRELLKLTEKPEIISFAGGLPAHELFPLDNLNEIVSKVIKEKGQVALQYASTDGYIPLRKIIIEERIEPERVKCDISNIMLTNGSQ